MQPTGCRSARRWRIRTSRIPRLGCGSPRKGHGLMPGRKYWMTCLRRIAKTEAQRNCSGYFFGGRICIMCLRRSSGKRRVGDRCSDGLICPSQCFRVPLVSSRRPLVWSRWMRMSGDVSGIVFDGRVGNQLSNPRVITLRIRRFLQKLFVERCEYRPEDCDQPGYLILETRKHGFQSPLLCLQHGWELYDEQKHRMIGQDPEAVQEYIERQGDTR